MNTQSRYKIQAPFASEGDPNNPPGDLGEGSYGVVYKALDLLTNTEVALKKIKMENQVDGISSSTLREITFLRQLKHENVIVLRDVEMHNNGRICLVFDLEDGDLAKLLSQSKEPFSAEAVQVRLCSLQDHVFCQLARTLSFIARGARRLLPLLTSSSLCIVYTVVRRADHVGGGVLSLHGRHAQVRSLAMCLSYKLMLPRLSTN
jgi:hypothetical protein